MSRQGSNLDVSIGNQHFSHWATLTQISIQKYKQIFSPQYSRKSTSFIFYNEISGINTWVRRSLIKGGKERRNTPCPPHTACASFGWHGWLLEMCDFIHSKVLRHNYVEKIMFGKNHSSFFRLLICINT